MSVSFSWILLEKIRYMMTMILHPFPRKISHSFHYCGHNITVIRLIIGSKNTIRPPEDKDLQRGDGTIKSLLDWRHRGGNRPNFPLFSAILLDFGSLYLQSGPPNDPSLSPSLLATSENTKIHSKNSYNKPCDAVSVWITCPNDPQISSMNVMEQKVWTIKLIAYPKS